MSTVRIPYGRAHLATEIADSRIQGILTSELEEQRPGLSEYDQVRQALDEPIGSPRLEELAAGKQNIVVLCSDHTRPVPSRIIIPQMLERLRAGSPEAKITLLIGTGCHRGTTKEELRSKFGDEIMDRETIYVHDCDDQDLLTHVGTLPSGGDIVINSIAAEADLLVSEGFIEPHFFAGFSGGRKAVFPGCCARGTVMYNHNAEFINNPNSRTGVLENNPIHRDMISAARQVGLDFICNVVINSEKSVIRAVAGDLERAHEAGAEWLSSYAGVPRTEADIVLTSNGGYPLDQNAYQAVKGMTAAESCVREGGVIICVSESSDGVGGDDFLRSFREEPSNETLMRGFLNTPRAETIPDQWQSQIFARVLMRATVIFVSTLDDQTVRDLHMTPARDLDEAMAVADQLVGADSRVTVIPDGVAVIVRDGEAAGAAAAA